MVDGKFLLTLDTTEQKRVQKLLHGVSIFFGNADEKVVSSSLKVLLHQIHQRISQ